MFPEIVRDDVFRLETRRLWLRWPTLADAAHPDMCKAAQLGDGAHAVTAASVTAWRAEMERGLALHLLLVTKADQTPIGSLHLVRNLAGDLQLDGSLHLGHRGIGLMTEAVQAAVHAAFTLVGPVSITASPDVDNRAGRDVLERCGFTYVGSGMRQGGAGRGLQPCDHFRLDHRTWSSLQGWAMPGFGAFLAARNRMERCERGCEAATA